MQGERLVLDGRPYTVKGIMPSMYDLTGKTAFYDDLGDGAEIFAPNRFWRDFEQAKPDIEAAFKYFRCTLAANTVRLLTPNPATFRGDILYHGAQPWYLADGSINPVYRERLVQFLDMALRRGVRVQLALMADVKETEWECENLAGEWTACPASETENSLSNAIRQAATRGPQSVRFVRPGSEREKFFFTYLRSLVPYLKGHPGILAYEIGNENLLRWELNGPYASGNEWYQNQVGSFLRRMIAEVRRLDGAHLIGSGEVGYYPWKIPWAPLAGEFGRIEDIDNLNGGAPYTLESLVDFIGAHLYSYISGNASETGDLVKRVAERSSKPLAPGEFNYYDDYKGVAPRLYPTPNPRRKAYYEMEAGFVDRGEARGFILYNPIPSIMSDPKEWRLADVTWNGQSRKGISIGQRKLLNVDTRSWIFGYDASKPFSLAPFPEASYFAELWRDSRDTAAFCAQ